MLTGEPPSPFVTIPRWVRISLIALYGVLLIGGLVYMAGHLESHPWMPVLFAAHIALAVFPLFLTGRKYGWFHPLVWSSISSLLILGHIRHLPMFVGALESHAALPTYGPRRLLGLVQEELALLVLGQATYYGAFFLPQSERKPRLEFTKPRHLRWKLLGVFLTALAAWGTFLHIHGGVTAWLAAWGQGRHDLFAAQHYWFLLVRLSVTSIFIYLIWDSDAPESPWFWVAVLSAMAMMWLLTGGRGQLVKIAMIAGMYWALRHHTIPWRIGVAGAVLGFFLLGVLTQIRTSTYSSLSFSSAFLDAGRAFEVLLDHLIARSTSRSGTLPILAKVPEKVGFLGGISYLAVVVWPFPRAFWPGKPGLTGGRVGETFFGLDAGIPPGAVGEAYWNFWIPGVIVVFALFGLLTRWVTDLYLQNPDSSPATMVYVMTLIILGPNTGALTTWLLWLVPLLIVLYGFGCLRIQLYSEPGGGPQDKGNKTGTRTP